MIEELKELNVGKFKKFLPWIIGGGVLGLIAFMRGGSGNTTPSKDDSTGNKNVDYAGLVSEVQAQNTSSINKLNSKYDERIADLQERITTSDTQSKNYMNSVYDNISTQNSKTTDNFNNAFSKLGDTISGLAEKISMQDTPKVVDTTKIVDTPKIVDIPKSVDIPKAKKKTSNNWATPAQESAGKVFKEPPTNPQTGRYENDGYGDWS